MKKIALILPILLLFTSCYKGKHVNLIIHNARIHVMNDQLDMSQAIAINNGKIVEVGPERQILNKYSADQLIDAGLKDVFPGFHDCHINLIRWATLQQEVDLRNAVSYYEIVSRLEKKKEKTHSKIIVGYGWDPKLWHTKQAIDNALLNKYFANIPVVIKSVNNQYMLINQAMIDFLDLSKIDTLQQDLIKKKNGRLSGLVSGKIIAFINQKLPKPTKKELKKNILKLQNKLLAAGITIVDQVGITASQRDLLIELSKDSLLKLNVYAMLLPSQENIDFAKENGHYQSYHLSIRSFNIAVDGNLANQKACMRAPYFNDTNAYGQLLKSPEELAKIAILAKKLDYQLNIQCIGDSANSLVLHMIDTLMKDKKNHRWRIEGAQFVNPKDFSLFKSSGVIPSIQPSFVTNNYAWIIQKVGKKRLEKEGYAYKTLRKESGMLLLGTNFPDEDFSPFANIFAAVHRMNIHNEPSGGFMKKEAISQNIALKAMTLWASFGSFQEDKIGTIESGKDADLIILGQPIENVDQYQPNYSWITIMDGKIVYDMR